MQWLNKIVDEILARRPEGEIVVSSGVSPSGTYHLGTLREVLTAEAIYRELKNRGRQSRHLHIVDDLDVFRKIPVGVPAEFEKYLGKPLCDVPAPDDSNRSYADYYLADLLDAASKLQLEMEVMRSHQKYRAGYFVPAIEKALENTTAIRQILEEISGRKLDDNWSPIQVIEDGYLKNRQFINIDTQKKEVKYRTYEGNEETASYKNGAVKLSWRVDWPARWALLGVDAEPFGRDHATKGGSYDTGAEIARKVYKIEPPLPLPYNFINRAGETKKMSKSAGNTITAAELLTILPAEIVWYFLLRFAPDKQLFFDEGQTLIRLIDEFAELTAKQDKNDQEKQLIRICMQGVEKPTVSEVPFSHLVASYQAALKNPQKTLEIVARTEHKDVVEAQREIIIEELKYIDQWLQKWAPEDVKFELLKQVDSSQFGEEEKSYLLSLGQKIAQAPQDADGEWFHKAIYELKESLGLQPQQIFKPLYKALIGKESGPRAGWFLSILPRDWLVKRLRLES